jgi:hypothetical protein
LPSFLLLRPLMRFSMLFRSLCGGGGGDDEDLSLLLWLLGDDDGGGGDEASEDLRRLFGGGGGGDIDAAEAGLLVGGGDGDPADDTARGCRGGELLLWEKFFGWIGWNAEPPPKDEGGDDGDTRGGDAAG